MAELEKDESTVNSKYINCSFVLIATCKELNQLRFLCGQK